MQIMHFTFPNTLYMKNAHKSKMCRPNWGISNTQKTYIYVNLTKNSDKNYENHTHFEFMQIMHICLFTYVFFFFFFFSLWAAIRLGTWRKIIVVKIYWWNLCCGCLYKKYFPSSDFELTQFM